MTCESTGTEGTRIDFNNGVTSLFHATSKTVSPRTAVYYVKTGNSEIGNPITIRVTGSSATQNIDNITVTEATSNEYVNAGVDNNMGGASWNEVVAADVVLDGSGADILAYNTSTLSYTFNALDPSKEYVVISTYNNGTSSRSMKLLVDTTEIRTAQPLKVGPEIETIVTTIPVSTYADDNSFTFTIEKTAGGNIICSELILTTKQELGLLGKIAEYSFNESTGDPIDTTSITGAGTLVEAGGAIVHHSTHFTIPSNSRVETGNLGLVATNTITLSCWVKPDSDTVNYGGIMYDLGSDCGLITKADKLGFMWNGAFWDETSTTPIVAGQWNFVAMVVKPTTVEFYSGTPVTPMTMSQIPATISTSTINTIRVGMQNAQAARSLPGSYANVRVWGDSVHQVDLEQIFEVEKTYFQLIATPAYGVEVTKAGSELNWTVDYEDGVVSYKVEKSIDGIWSTITTVAATGEANATYSVTVGEGEFRVVAIDASGFTQAFATSANNNTVTTFLNIESGWNLISVPSENANLSSLSTTIWGWDGKQYVEVKEPKALQGLWIFSDSNKELTVKGTKVASAEVSLTNGWNLVGPAENCKKPTGLTVFTWCESYKALLDQDSLIVGQGYWIYSDNEQQVNLK